MSEGTRENMTQLCRRIQAEPFHESVVDWMYAFTNLITEHGQGAIENDLTSLLQHPHHIIRFEAAATLAVFGPLSFQHDDTYLHYLFSRKEFDQIQQQVNEGVSSARDLLIRGMLDPFPAIRGKAVAAWTGASGSPWEVFAESLALGKYHTLPHHLQDSTIRERGLNVLRILAVHPLNSDYHRRQCREALDCCSDSKN